MVSLGLDLSVTGPGVVILRKEKGIAVPIVLHGEEMKTLDAGAHVLWDRARHIMQGVADLVVEHRPDVIVIEGYAQSSRHGNVDSFIKQVTVGSFVRDMLHRHGFQWLECPPTSLKKFVTGKGSATKAEMKRGVLKHWGFKTRNHNVADGYGLAMLGLAKHSVVAVSPTQCDAMDRVEPDR